MTDRPTSQHLYESLTRIGHRIADQTRFFTDKDYREAVFLARARQICRDNWDKISKEVSESREMTQLLWRYTQGETLTPEEMQSMKQQILDLVRVVPALGIFALPGGLILLPLLVKAFPWGLVPSAWRKVPTPATSPSTSAATATPSASGRRVGVVVAQHGRHTRVDDGEKLVECVWRGKLHRKSSAKPVVVGDRVEFTSTSPGEGIIEAVLPRRTKLSRKRKDGRSSEHVLVANVDRVALIASAKDPPFDRTMVERVLVATDVAGLEPLLVVNKLDLVLDEGRRSRPSDRDEKTGSSPLVAVPEIESFLASLEKHGVEVVRVSALTGRGLDRLAGALAGRTTALCGPSGVGKSTLVNRLCPDATQRTGEIITSSRLGRHTTSDITLLPLPSGGHIVDMPGIREFGLWDVTREDVLRFFPEFESLADACRFRQCTHDHEPDCRVKQAASTGEIDPERHLSYLRLLKSL